MRQNLESRTMGNRLASLVIVAVILASVTVLDYLALPQLDMSIAYFIPILFAAWRLGRLGSMSVAMVAEIQAILDQLRSVPQQSFYVAAANTVVRLLVYVFVAEVTVRLVNSNIRVRQTLDELRNSDERLLYAYERLEEDIQAAGIVQSEVLEIAIPKVPSCDIGVCLKYAREVGGDFADVGVIGDKVYACVADVSGKGVPAALFTTLLKHLLLEGHAQGQHTEEVIAMMSQSLTRVLPAEYFVTLIYAEFDPNNGVLEYVNAGHPPGLIYRTRTAELVYANANMPLLAYWHGDIPIVPTRIALDFEDVLMLYTDGAIESKRPDGSRLGSKFIEHSLIEYASLSAQDIASKICERVLESTIETGRDDVTILCLKNTGTL
ncbi:MAG: serine/threonine-protein phosphatase [Armatimonadetes bacterium]|nr:serine/threonine-protein phosphatase [Armatimonadota bacterium]